MTDKQALVVLGMHRSGTSALSRSLSVLGYAQPTDLMAPQLDNPRGFWESSGIARLNDKILADIGGSWDRPGPYLIPGFSMSESRQKLGMLLIESWLAKAVTSLKDSYGGSPRIVVKDPRMVVLLPLWRRAFLDAGYRARYIAIYRNPLEVAASLRVRNGMPRVGALQLWIYTNLLLLEFALDTPLDGMLHFDDLLKEPESALASLVARLEDSASKLNAEATTELKTIISPLDQHHLIPSSEVENNFRLPPLVKDLWNLFRSWEKSSASQRIEAVSNLWSRFNEASLFQGGVRTLVALMPTKQLQAKKVDGERAQKTINAPLDYIVKNQRKIKPDSFSEMSNVLIHYHLFKNAGTSVDRMLQSNFGARWTEAEFEIPRESAVTKFPFNANQVGSFLEERPDILALSSHTALLPVPVLKHASVVPIFFIRHPLDRLKSAYVFERQQDSSTYGARLAKLQGFQGYLRELIEHPIDRSARNFQTYRLSFNEKNGSELERALRLVESVPFVGLVEAYDQSLQLLQDLIAGIFDGFKAMAFRENVQRSEEYSLGRKLAVIREELGEDLYEQVCEANSDDIVLFETVAERYVSPL